MRRAPADCSVLEIDITPEQVPPGGEPPTRAFIGADSADASAGLELAYCNVIGTFISTTDNHDGVRPQFLQAPWIHGNEIQGLTGLTGNSNSAGIKLYVVRNALVEDNYIHDNNAGIFDKQSGIANVYRRNWLTANALEPFEGNNQASEANYQLYDNVIDGQVGLHSLTDGAVVYNNLVRADSLAGSWDTLVVNSQLWNNIVIGGAAPIVAYYAKKAYLSWTPSPLNYMDYNVYNQTPTYQFGVYVGGDSSYALADMQARGFEQHASIAATSNIFVDTVSYQLKPAWETAGRTGGPVGPDSTAAVLNKQRYGPGARP